MWIALGRILPSDERTRLSWHERFAFVYFMQVAKSPISQGVQKGKAPACGSNRSEWQTLSFWSNCLGWGSTRWRSTARAVGWTPSCHAWEKRTWFVSWYFTKWASLATWCPRQYRRRKRNGWFWGLQILETKIQQVATLRSLISGDNIVDLQTTRGRDLNLKLEPPSQSQLVFWRTLPSTDCIIQKLNIILNL